MKPIILKTMKGVFESKRVSSRLNSASAICLAFAAGPDPSICNLKIIASLFTGLLLLTAALFLISGCRYIRTRWMQAGTDFVGISGKPEITPKR
jgi:hypothetical protein